jgi:hypothetical protein
MIVPAGFPAWTRAAVPDHYGAVPGLHDLGNCGAVNARTDITAASYTRMAADCVGAVRGAPLFWVRFTTSVGPVATVNQCQPMWGPASGAYAGAAPSSVIYPSIVWSSGSYVLTFPGLVVTAGGVRYIRMTDDYQVVGDCQMSTFLVGAADTGDISASLVDGAELHISLDSGVYTQVSLVVY